MNMRLAKFVALSALIVASAAQAENRCNPPHDMIDARACAKAAEGPDALRQFVERTRMLWNLYYWDYARRDAADLTMTKTAPAKSKQIAATARAD